MKPLSKLLLRIVAIVPLVLYCSQHIFTLTCYEKLSFDTCEIVWRAFQALTLICMAIGCFVIYNRRNIMPKPDKPFRIATRVATYILLLSIIVSLCKDIHINEYFFFCVPTWLHIIGYMAVGAWLWLLSDRIGEEKLSKPVATITIVCGIMEILLIVLLLIAGIYIMHAGHVLAYGMGTHYYFNWLEYSVPTMIICSYALLIRDKQHWDRVWTSLIWILFAIAIIMLVCELARKYEIEKECAAGCRQVMEIDKHLQSIVAEEMQTTLQETSPKWASAIIMDVPTGKVLAMYSSDSVEHYKDTIHLGTLVIPEILGEALHYSILKRDAKVTIHKEGVTIDSLRFYDSNPRDTILDIAGVIATSSMVGAATMLEPLGIAWVNLLREASRTTMLEETNQFCFLIDDQNRYIHNRDKQVILKGMHEVVWNDELGTASVRKWLGKVVAKKVQSDIVRIAGKTGSVQLNDSVNGRPNYRLSFIGYFPEEAPKYCCLVVIDSPSNYPFYDAGYDCGGTVRRIAERIYKD